MKLSEAIRLGSMIKPQAFGSFFTASGSCALGAAMDATNMTSDAFIGPTWPWLQQQDRQCPVCSCVRMVCRTDAMIVHLNDEHEWTREAIADWVETIEPAEVVKEEKKEVLEEICV